MFKRVRPWARWTCGNVSVCLLAFLHSHAFPQRARSVPAKRQRCAEKATVNACRLAYSAPPQYMVRAATITQPLKMKSKPKRTSDVFTRHVREKRLQRAEQLGAVKALLVAAEREIRTLIPTAPGGIAINGDPDGLETNGQSISQRAAVSLAEIAESARMIHAQAVKGRALVECEVNGEILAAGETGRKFAAFAEAFDAKGAKA